MGALLASFWAIQPVFQGQVRDQQAQRPRGRVFSLGCRLRSSQLGQACVLTIEGRPAPTRSASLTLGTKSRARTRAKPALSLSFGATGQPLVGTLLWPTIFSAYLSTLAPFLTLMSRTGYGLPTTLSPNGKRSLGLSADDLCGNTKGLRIVQLTLCFEIFGRSQPCLCYLPHLAPPPSRQTTCFGSLIIRTRVTTLTVSVLCTSACLKRQPLTGLRG